jgi:[ribosomal protein S18]-alanine N-acetyltransferase
MAEIHAAAFAGGETWDEAMLTALLARPGTLAVADGPDAFALLQVIPPEAELLTIAVHPQAQGRGLGRTLMAGAMAAAGRAGCTILHLEVAADNAPARALYAGAGLVETGRRRGYYARPAGARSDALILSAQLSGSGPSA